MPHEHRAEDGPDRGEDARGARLRELPSVERLAAVAGAPHAAAVAAARAEIAELRDRILGGAQPDLDPAALERRVAARAARLAGPSLRPVINATGVVLHTNLGRAPLAAGAAAAAATVARGYSNLEYDISAGERGSRHVHVEGLLRELTGAAAAIAVNNNAAAVLLALSALAAGGEVVIGRDQLVEIGGSFRIPDILALSGAELVEVGTTNRTRIADFESAIGSRTRALMRVHQSNFRTVGFTTSPSLAEICAVARAHGLPVIDDLGSGATERIGDEPLVQESVTAGAAVVCFSSDKLLGGPQAGVLAGGADQIAACRSHPLARAVRLDKMQLAALEATLRLRRDRGPEAIPAAAMIAADPEVLRGRAERMAAIVGVRASVREEVGRAGGGTLPTHELPGSVCAVEAAGAEADELALRLREHEPPVIARIGDGMVLLDPRTMSEDEAQLAAEAVRAALV